MELKFVIPNMAKSLGNLEFGGPAEVKRGDTRRNGTQTKVLYRPLQAVQRCAACG